MNNRENLTLKGRPVLVTGGAGYIGSHVVLALLEAGAEVVVIDNLSMGHRNLVSSEATFIEGDLLDKNHVSKVLKNHKIETVIHLAGSTIVPESLEMPLRYYENNVCASRALFEACEESGVSSIIFSSTAAVYGDVGHDFASESVAPDPQTPYGRSKLVVEWMLDDFAQSSGTRYASLRYFNVAGADPDMRCGQINENATHLIKVACEAATGHRDSITIFGSDYDTRDGTCIRDFIHVSDLAQIHVKMAEYLLNGGENAVLNCGYGRGVSVKEATDAATSQKTSDFKVIDGERRLGDMPQVVADISKLSSLLDWRPRFDNLDTIISTALDWERHRGKIKGGVN